MAPDATLLGGDQVVKRIHPKICGRSANRAALDRSHFGVRAGLRHREIVSFIMNKPGQSHEIELEESTPSLQ